MSFKLEIEGGVGLKVQFCGGFNMFCESTCEPNC